MRTKRKANAKRVKIRESLTNITDLDNALLRAFNIPNAGVKMVEKKNFSIQVLLLDADRNPIKNHGYKIIFNGVVISGNTGGEGLTKENIHSNSV